MGVQDQQEDRLAHGDDGRREGTHAYRPTVSANLLAHGAQGAELNQFAGVSDEYGRDLAQQGRLWTRLCCLARWSQPCRGLLCGKCVHRAGHTARRSRCISGRQDRAATPSTAGREHDRVQVLLRSGAALCAALPQQEGLRAVSKLFGVTRRSRRIDRLVRNCFMVNKTHKKSKWSTFDAYNYFYLNDRMYL